MFDERQHPLDDSKAWLETPEDDDVVDFLRTIQQALHLEMSCIVTALILLERGMLRAKLRLSPSTWRPLLIVAIAIASKVVLDEKVFLGDYCELLPSLSLLGLRALTEARRRRQQRAAALCRPRPAPVIAPPSLAPAARGRLPLSDQLLDRHRPQAVRQVLLRPPRRRAAEPGRAHVLVQAPRRRHPGLRPVMP